MIGHGRLIACAVLSVAAHVALAHELRRLPARASDTTKRVVSIRVVSPPPPAPEPPPEAPPPEAPKPQPVVHEHVRARPTPPHATPVPDSPPPPDVPRPTADPSAAPVFGVTMESTSPGGGGPALPVGNSGRGGPAQSGGGNGNGTDRHAPPAALPPVEAYQVTKLPQQQGQCMGIYTDEARQAATEGTVVLDLIVDEKGRAREIHVVSGLPHGLTEAAIAALKACHFDPGEKDGAAVPVRVRGFKISFFSPEAE